MNMKKRLLAVFDTVLAVGATIAAAVLIMGLFNCYYDLNDDILMKDILSGTYTGSPDGHNIQMLYPLSALIGLFYKLLPALPWYGIFLCSCEALCFYLVTRRMVSLVENVLKKAVVLALTMVMFASLLLWEAVYVQYSVICSLLAATGIFLFCTTDDTLPTAKFIKKNIISMLLLIISFYLRTEMMLLLCPMMAAAGIIKWFGGAKRSASPKFRAQNLVRYLTTPMMVAVGMALGLIANAVAYRSPQWQEFNDFFDARTELYDFQEKAPDYEENEEFYVGLEMTQAQKYLLDNYNFALDKSLNADKLLKIVEYNKEKVGKKYFRYGFFEGFKQYVLRIVHRVDAPWIYVIAMLYLFILVTGHLLHSYSGVLQVLIMLFARSVGWMYLIMRGRMQDRITNSLCLCETMVLAAILLSELKYLYREYRQKVREAAKAGERKPYLPAYRRFWPVTMASILTVLLLIPLVREFRSVEAEQNRRESVNYEWKLLTDYFMEHPENYYVLDVYSTVAYSEPMFRDVDNSYRNYDICGGWASKSPVYAGKLAKHGISDLQMDLMLEDNVFFVSRADRDVEWLSWFYRSQGIEVSVDPHRGYMVQGEIRFVMYRVKFKRMLTV